MPSQTKQNHTHPTQPDPSPNPKPKNPLFDLDFDRVCDFFDQLELILMI